MTTLRLMADDLTGALDTAAEFVACTGPIDVRWDEPLYAQSSTSLAIDSGTRERSLTEAVAKVAQLAPALVDGDISYKKVDSLLRGHVMAELAACWRLGAWDHCVVAPAFPYQGRVTRAGVQHTRMPSGAWSEVADLEMLAAGSGLAVVTGQASLQNGIQIFDAETDEDLARIAALGRAARGRVLWCGSAGLAQALVGRAHRSASILSRPFLGLFGSDQPVTARQLAACGDQWMPLPDGGAHSARALAEKLEHDGAALASFDLPAGITRAEAASRIAVALSSLLRRLPRPNTLAVAGGETLRAICAAMGATSIEATGQIEPGLPLSMMRGGAWDGVRIVSKSGAFGPDTLWRDLLRSNGLVAERVCS